jgi:glycosyltransferase involved in cell wall biosynthesis
MSVKSKNLRVWLIKVGEQLPIENNRKMRTALLAEKLLDRSASVLWWTSAFDHFKKRWLFPKDKEINLDSGLKIMALKGCGYRRNFSLFRFLDHRILAKKFKSISRKLEKPDIILSANPPYDLAKEAVEFAKERDIPIIVDIRDQWPDIFVAYTPKLIRFFARLILAHEFRMNTYVLREADSLTSMMETLLAWGLKCAGRQRTDLDKVFYLGAEKMEEIPHSEKIDSLKKQLEGKFVVAFVGTFGMRNNPAILVDAARSLSNNNVIFVLGGDGIYFEEVKRKAEVLPNVVLTGWLKQNDITALLRHAHVGVIPNSEEFAAFPNKAFAYVSAGLPIISSCQGELKKIIEDTKIGLNYRPRDVCTLTECLRYFLDHQEVYAQYVERVRSLFKAKFDSEVIYNSFADHIENIVERRKER